MIVTLDGPNGVGKTAVARELARALGWRWASAGMLYRSIALWDGDDSPLLVQFETAPDGVADPVVQLGTHLLREADLLGDALSARASELALDPAVRRRVQLALHMASQAAPQGVVLEGRSMNRLMPDAALHCYLWADSAERDIRSRAIGEHLDAERESRDRARAEDPLRVRPGMTVWNSTRFHLSQTVEGLARRTWIALGLRLPVIPLIAQPRVFEVAVQALAGRELSTHRVDPDDDDAIEAALLEADVAFTLTDNGYPCALIDQLDTLLSGNDLVSAGPRLHDSQVGVDLNLTGKPQCRNASKFGNVGVTADVFQTEARGDRRFEPWLNSVVARARWLFTPGPGPDNRLVLHHRAVGDSDRLLEELQAADSSNVIVVDHVGDPRLALWVEAALPGQGIRVLAIPGRSSGSGIR